MISVPAIFAQLDFLATDRTVVVVEKTKHGLVHLSFVQKKLLALFTYAYPSGEQQVRIPGPAWRAACKLARRNTCIEVTGITRGSKLEHWCSLTAGGTTFEALQPELFTVKASKGMDAHRLAVARPSVLAKAMRALKALDMTEAGFEIHDDQLVIRGSRNAPDIEAYFMSPHWRAGRGGSPARDKDAAAKDDLGPTLHPATACEELTGMDAETLIGKSESGVGRTIRVFGPETDYLQMPERVVTVLEVGGAMLRCKTSEGAVLTVPRAAVHPHDRRLIPAADTNLVWESDGETVNEVAITVQKPNGSTIQSPASMFGVPLTQRNKP